MKKYLAITAALALALTNQVLSAVGKPMLPIESAQLEQLISSGLTVAAALASWWNNNSFTPEAIEADDFMEVPVPKYKRLTPNGPECRLKGAYLIRCTGCVKDENGKVVEVHCTYDPESRGGNSPDGRKVKGTIHWVNAEQSVKAQVRLYENIIDEEKGVYNEDGSLNLNPNSLTTLTECRLEPAFAQAQAYDRFQFVRQGFFCVDYKDTKPGELVFNRIVSLKSSYVLPK